MSRLSLRLASYVAGVVLVLLWVVPSLWSVDSLPGALLVAVGAAAVAYVAVHRQVAVRVESARDALQRIEQQDFDHIEVVPPQHDDEIDRLTEQVYRTGQTFEREIEKMHEMENYRREFIGNVSHELKTPIFAIQGFAETLLGGALDDQQVNRSFVDKIQHNALRLHYLARDLTDISHIERGEMELRRQPFDLQRAIREVVGSLEPLAADKDVTLRFRLPGPLPEVEGDPERIRQVLVNLVDNAIKYNDAGGYVEVVARVLPDGDVKVSVADNGIGIASEHLPRLTERFYRVDTSRSRSQGGTGLGLAIVKHILGAHDRRLQVESSAGRGSTFGFTLPSVERG